MLAVKPSASGYNTLRVVSHRPGCRQAAAAVCAYALGFKKSQNPRKSGQHQNICRRLAPSHLLRDKLRAFIWAGRHAAHYAFAVEHDVIRAGQLRDNEYEYRISLSKVWDVHRLMSGKHTRHGQQLQW